MSLGYIRQGITLAGRDVVIVAADEASAAEVRAITEEAVAQHGDSILLRSGHAVGGDPVLTAPVSDGERLIGYVELAADDRCDYRCDQARGHDGPHIFPVRSTVEWKERAAQPAPDPEAAVQELPRTALGASAAWRKGFEEGRAAARAADVSGHLPPGHPDHSDMYLTPEQVEKAHNP